MEIRKIVDRELTETEQATIEHFAYYFSGRQDFACLAEYVVMPLDSRSMNDMGKIKEEIAGVLRSHPDFSTYVMDDGFGLVILLDKIYGITPEKLTEEEIQKGEMDLVPALLLRQDCLEACQNETVIAIISKEKA